MAEVQIMQEQLSAGLIKLLTIKKRKTIYLEVTEND